jgi:hypothetical protein
MESTMKKSDILRQVRANLPITGYICNQIKHPIDHLHNISLTEQRNRFSLVSWIRELLDGYSTLETWLVRVHNAPPGKTEWAPRSDIEATQKLFDTRKAWLDWMISYWEAEEAKAVA